MSPGDGACRPSRKTVIYKEMPRSALDLPL